MTHIAEEQEARARVRKRLEESLGANALQAVVPALATGGAVAATVQGARALEGAAKTKGFLTGVSALAPVAKVLFAGTMLVVAAAVAVRAIESSNVSIPAAPGSAAAVPSTSPAERVLPAERSNTTAASPPTAETMFSIPATESGSRVVNVDRFVERAEPVRRRREQSAQAPAIEATSPAPDVALRTDVVALNAAARAARAFNWSGVRTQVQRFFANDARDTALDETAFYLDALAACGQRANGASQTSAQEVMSFRERFPRSHWLAALLHRCAATAPDSEIR